MMPHFSNPKLLQRANDLAERYHGRPSTMLGIDDPYLAWCIDEAAAIASNLAFKQKEADEESILDGPSGRVDLRDYEAANAPQRNHIRKLPNGQQIINGSFPVKWRDNDA